MDNVADLSKELCYICKNKYNEEINSLNTKDTKNLTTKKLRLTDDFQDKSEMFSVTIFSEHVFRNNFQCTYFQ